MDCESAGVNKYLENHQKTPIVVIGCKKYKLFFFNNQGGDKKTGRNPVFVNFI